MGRTGENAVFPVTPSTPRTHSECRTEATGSPNESRPRADLGPARGRVTWSRPRGVDPGHIGPGAKGSSCLSPSFPSLYTRVYPPTNARPRACSKSGSTNPRERRALRCLQGEAFKHANRWSQSESAPPRAVSVDPGPVAFSVSPDPGLTPGQRQAP